MLSARLLVDKFSDYLLTEKQYSALTVKSYQSDLGLFFSNVSEIPVIDIQQSDIQNFIFSLKRKNYQSKTIARKLSSIRAFFNFLLKTGLISSNPCFDLSIPKSSKRLPETLTAEETEQLLTPLSDRNIDVRDLAMIDLIYACGLRVSECSKLDMQNISLKEKKIWVTGKGNKQRIVFFGDKTKGNLKKWLKIRENSNNILLTHAFFVNKNGGRLGIRSIQTRLKKFAVSHGIYKNIHPHMLRHSFATDILQSSGDIRAVQELLGHKNISTTQIYTHLDFDHLYKEYSSAHPRANKK